MELWQQCVQWLKACGVLDEHFAFRRLEDFAVFLSDGVLLCRLALQLDESSIDEAQIICNESANSQFISTGNIGLFLDSCKSAFHLSDTDLFQESDLFELGDFRKVLHVISALSWSDQSRSRGLVPFGEPNHENLNLSHEEEGLYSELRKNVETLNAEALAIRQQNYSALQVSQDEKREQLYNSFIYQRKRAFSDFKPSCPREYYLKELLDTENNFCDTLTMIIHDYYEPMAKFVPEDDMGIIFINIKDLFRLHQEFLRYLQKAVMFSLGLEQKPEYHIEGVEPVRLNVADAFLAFKLRFIIYSEYCSRLDKGRDHVIRLAKDDPAFKKKLLDCQENSERPQFNLWDLLTVPMQRILKYHLILKEIFDRTPISDLEHKDLESAYDAMRDVNCFINEATRDFKTMFVFEQYNVKIRNCTLPDGITYKSFGRPIQDGLLKVMDTKIGENSGKVRHVFLFERMIMFCKPRGAAFEFRTAYSLADLEVADAEDDTVSRNSTLSRKLTTSLFDYKLFLSFRRIGHQTVPATDPGHLQFSFKTDTQRDQWRKNVDTALDIAEPRQATARKHRVFYRTYTEAKYCDACNKLLYGLFFQGYSCKRCNQNLHHACLGLMQCPGEPRPKPRTSRCSLNEQIMVGGGQRLFMKGEQLLTTQAIQSADGAVLNFGKDELIEVVRDEGGSNFDGRLVRSPSSVGKVLRHMVRPASTAAALVRRRSSLTHLVQNGGADALPAGQIRVSPNLQKPQHETLQNRGVSDRVSASSMGETNGNGQILVSKAILDGLSPQSEDAPVKDYPWYFFELNRPEANAILQGLPNGTFLVRWSPAQQKYILSLAYDGMAKHMKIEFDTQKQMYWLHDTMFFHKIPALIHQYRKTNLNEGFKDIFCHLEGIPLRTTQYEVVHQYENRDARDKQKYLTMQPGQQLTVIDTSGDDNGWWKGEIEGKVGFFPITYVRELTPSTDDTEVA